MAYNIEFGAECSEQSALNLVYLLGYIGQGRLRLFGGSDEKHHVRGGNDEITRAMGAAVEDQITMCSELVAIRRNAHGDVRAHVRAGRDDEVRHGRPRGAGPAVLDHAPLGGLVEDRLRAGEVARDPRAADGNELEAQRRVQDPPLASLGCNGETYGDTGFQNTWEVSRGQPGAAGILVGYTGGRIGDSFRSGSPGSLTRRFLGQLEPVLPGVSAQWDGNAVVDHWPSQPWALGSYSYYKPGQYRAFGASEEEISGACHFAGEHTTQDFQGYLQGAVFSGQRAAAEVLAAI